MYQSLPHSTKQRTVALVLQRLDRRIRQRSSRPLEGVEACIQIHEGELQTQRGGQSFQNASACRNDFSTDAIAGDEA